MGINETWYHVVTSGEKPSAYGFCVIDGKVSDAADRISWAVGHTLDFVLKFYEKKPASVAEVKVYLDEQKAQ